MNTIIIVMGPPGAGKGTHAALIAARYKGIAISAGAELRAAVEKRPRDPLCIKAAEHMRRGTMVPHYITYSLTFPAIKRAFKQASVVVIDGMKTRAQIYAYFRMFATCPQPVQAIIVYLDVADKDARGRLHHRGRADDAATKTISKRFEIQGSVQQKKLLPILRKRAQVVIVKGTGTIKEVQTAIERHLDKIL